MKSLKQIREENNVGLSKQIEILSDEVVLESAFSKDAGHPEAKIPSSKQMPTILIFRRITYRTYPKGQVIALYYSKMVDKYLSIPFGPTGNLNLSESFVTDTLEEACWKGYQMVGMKKKGNRKVPNCVPVEEDWVSDGMSAAGGMAGTALGGPVGGAIGKWLGKKLGSKLSGDDKEKQAPAQSAPEPEDKPNVSRGGSSAAKIHTGSAKRPSSSDAVYQSKMKQATLKQATSVQENKITDIREMINENIDSKDININGRTITLNTSMAKRILEVYDSVNTKNKKIVESMLNDDLESFKKLLTFSIRN